MDRTNTNPAYLQGRLCAVLKTAHDLCDGKFARINMSLAPEHPQKELAAVLAHSGDALKNQPSLEGELGQIMNLIDVNSDVSRLGVEDQGRFWLGYYHEMGCIDEGRLVKPVVESVERHSPERIDCGAAGGNEIDDLKR